MKKQLTILALFLLCGLGYAQFALMQNSSENQTRQSDARLSAASQMAEDPQALADPKATWDVLFTYNFSAAAPGMMGTFFWNGQVYGSRWNPAATGNAMGRIYRYNISGTTLIPDGTIDIPGLTGSYNFEGFTTDGSFIYGVNEELFIYKIDPATWTIAQSIPITGLGSDFEPLAIAYDPPTGGFWLMEIGGTVARLVSSTGSNTGTSLTGASALMGIAYDNETPGGPWLITAIGSSNTTNVARLGRWNITSGAYDGNIQNVATLPGGVTTGNSMGGIFTYADNGKLNLLGISQGATMFFAYELADMTDPNAPGQATSLTATPDPGGALTAVINWNNPALTFGGAPLTDLTSVQVFQSGITTPVYTNNSPTIGAAGTYTATMTATGPVTFRIVGTNSFGPGEAAMITTRVGPAVFSGAATLAAGTILNNIPLPNIRQYQVTNTGGVLPLTVSMDASSNAALTVTGPITVLPGETGTLFVEISASTLPTGAFSGNLVLNTNDPNQAQVTVTVTATVNAAIISDFIFEEFTNTTTPAGWVYERYSRQTTGGVNNSPALRANIYGTTDALRNGTVQTSYVNMGADPILAFMYKVTNFSNPTTTTVAANTFQYAIELTADFGGTWQTIYTSGPNADAIAPTLAGEGFEPVIVDVSAFANQICMVRIRFTSIPSADLYAWIDDVIVGTLNPDPVFEGPATVSAGTVFNNIPAIGTATYSFGNAGGSDLTITGVTTTLSELTIDGTFPMTIGSLENGSFTVSLNGLGLATGPYSGDIVISTNDPVNPTITVAVTATVNMEFISTFISEDFTATTMPQGWQYAFTGNATWSRQATGGFENSPAIRANIYGTPTSTTFNAICQTSYVAMGANPVLSFMYKITTFSSPTTTTVPVGVFQYRVAITTDYGTTWDTIFESGPNTDPIAPTAAGAGFLESAPIDVSAYAGQVIRARIIFSSIPVGATGNPDLYAWIDNVNVGAPPQNELEAVSLSGPAMPTVNIPETYTVVVKNNGALTQTALTYDVVLFEGIPGSGTPIDTLPGVEIAYDETKSFHFTWTPTVAGSTTLYAYVNMPTDEFPGNNTSNRLNIAVQPSGTIAVIVGEGTVEARMPIDFLYHGSLVQNLYFPSEIGTNGGDISALGYRFRNTSTSTTWVMDNIPVQVWIGETTAGDLSAAWVDPTTLTQVFNGTMNFPLGEYDVTIPFSTPYTYQGGTLVVYTYKQQTTWGSGTFFFSTTDAGSNRSRVRFADAQLNPADPGAGTANSNHPNTTFMMDVTGMGGVEGMVRSSAAGTPVIAGANVQLLGSQLNTKSNALGAYIFPYLVPGSYNLEVSAFGYYTDTVAITITPDAMLVQNITLVPWANYSVSGQVTGNDAPAGLQNVEVTLSATIPGAPTNPVTFTATTNATGQYSIANVIDGQTYNVEAKLTGYTTWTGTVAVAGANVTNFNILLNEILFPVVNPTATVVDNNVNVAWELPGTEQNPTITFAAGNVWGDGTGYQMLISNNPASWSTAAGPLTTGQIPTTGPLAACGRPANYYDTYFDIRIPANADPACNTQNIVVNNSITIEIPAGIYNYAIVNPTPTGQANLWIAGGANGRRQNYVFEEGKNYHFLAQMCGENDCIVITVTDMKTGAKTVEVVEMFTRASLSNTDNVRVATADQAPAQPFVGEISVPTPIQSVPKALLNYSVYRFLEGTPETGWGEPIAPAVTALTYTDNTWSTLAQGMYQYAVKANYTGGFQSPARLTNVLPRDMEVAFTVNLSTNSGDPVVGAVVTLTNQDGISAHVYTQTATANAVVFPAVWKGTYDIRVELVNHDPATRMDVEIQTAGSISITLSEIIEDPFNLEIYVQGATATLTWNNTYADDNFFDDVEGHASWLRGSTIGEYTTHNVNTEVTYGFGSTASFPGSHEAFAWIVFDFPAWPLFGGDGADIVNMTPYSGNKAFACFTKTSGVNNDWLILPKRLVGPRTKFEFMAKSNTNAYNGGERFRVAVSTTGTAVANFTTVLTPTPYVVAPRTWTKYSYDVSQFSGQEIHVAINCVTDDEFVFLVDDIFLGDPGTKGGTRAFNGFSVYLNDLENPVATGITEEDGLEYTFEGLQNGNYTAGVAAVYTSGSSMETIDFVITDGVNIVITNRELFTVYPNPVSDELHIQTSRTINRIEMLDLNGKVLGTWVGDNKTINVQNIPAGNYILRIHTEKSIVPIKIVKQ